MTELNYRLNMYVLARHEVALARGKVPNDEDGEGYPPPSLWTTTEYVAAVSKREWAAPPPTTLTDSCNKRRTNAAALRHAQNMFAGRESA